MATVRQARFIEKLIEIYEDRIGIYDGLDDVDDIEEDLSVKEASEIIDELKLELGFD
jgi:hypothetical protein